MVSADNVQQTYYPCVIRIFLMSVTWGQWLMWLWKATAWTACKNTQLTWINRYESTTSWLIPCVVLKEIHYAHFQVHSIVIGYYYDKFTCLNAPKTHHVFQIVQCCSFVSPSVLAPVSLKPLPLVYPIHSDWSAHTCLMQWSFKQQSSCAESSLMCQTSCRLCKRVTPWCSHRIKVGGTADEASQEHCFLWDRGAAVGPTLTFLTSKIFLHAKEPLTKMLICLL